MKPVLTDTYVRTASLMAVLFSSISCFFELLCVLLYAFVFPKLLIVKFYRSKAASEGSLTVTADLAAGGIKSHPDPLVCTE
jgi:solute carrier family 29 (equilibrative nucleoside transporter), member 1/2/3